MPADPPTTPAVAGRRLLIGCENPVSLPLTSLIAPARLLRFARNDTRNRRHCEERSDEAISDPRLFIQPDVFHAKIVDDAVDHHRPALDLRLPAIGEAVEKDDRPRPVLGQLLFDLPHQLLALALVDFHRLLLELIFELGVAIAGVVTRRTAAIVLIELLVRVVDAAAGEIEPDLEILAIHLGVPKGGFDDLELAADKYLLQLIDQQHRRIAERRDVASRHLERQPLAGTIAELAHDLAGLGAVLLHVGVISWQGVLDFARHAPDPFGQRLHDPADVALALADDVDKRLAVEAQRHRPPHIRIVEGRRVAEPRPQGVYRHHQ